MSSLKEKNIDDLFYEDEFYKDEFEELDKDQDEMEDLSEDNIEPEVAEREVFFVCNECTKQWDEIITEDKIKNSFCPSCGSIDISEI